MILIRWVIIIENLMVLSVFESYRDINVYE